MPKKPNNTVHNAKEAAEVHQQLVEQGYVPIDRPAHFGRNAQVPSFGDGMAGYVRSKIYAGCSDPSKDPAGRAARDRIPLVFASSGTEMATSDNIGTKGLGYIQWGGNNQLPNIVSLLMSILPYTAAGHKFNVDLVTGLGPQPMYHYTQYVGGNITEKDIPYESAGTLLKGMMLDIQRQLSQIDDSTSSRNNDNPSERNNAISSFRDDDNPLRTALEERLAELKADLAEWERTNKELQDFLERNNLLQTYLHLAADQILLGMCFPEIELQQTYIDDTTNRAVKTTAWKPKAVGLRYRPAHTTRLERMDDQNRINYVYVSNQWYDNTVAKDGDDYKIDAIPTLSPDSPVADLRRALRETRNSNVTKSKRPTRFVLPTQFPTPGRPYYPIPAWWSIFAGGIYEYAYTIIDDRATAKKNSNVIGRIIYIHNDYLMQMYNQMSLDTDEKKRKFRDELFSEINTFLKDKDNMGKPLVSFKFRDGNGNTTNAWEIVEIESNSKSTAEANQKELQEISSIIFFAMSLDSRLVGNTPGTESSSGGTDLRERFLLKQIQMSPTQQLILYPLKVISTHNEWDPRHLRWSVKREVMTTLDNSKTGVAAAEDTQ